MPTPEKKTLTDDQIAMLAYLGDMGTFDDKALFAFFSGKELWSKSHKIQIFQELRVLKLIRANQQKQEPINENEGIVHHVGWHLTDEAKALLKNYQKNNKKMQKGNNWNMQS